MNEERPFSVCTAYQELLRAKKLRDRPHCDRLMDDEVSVGSRLRRVGA